MEPGEDFVGGEFWLRLLTCCVGILGEREVETEWGGRCLKGIESKDGHLNYITIQPWQIDAAHGRFRLTRSKKTDDPMS